MASSFANGMMQGQSSQASAASATGGQPNVRFSVEHVQSQIEN